MTSSHLKLIPNVQISSQSNIDVLMQLAKDTLEWLARQQVGKPITSDEIAILHHFISSSMEVIQGQQIQTQKLSVDSAKNETALKQREEFLNVCAHDLRSPLGLIQTSLTMILTSKISGLDTVQLELLTRAKRQVGHALTLVNDLLDVTSMEQGLKPQYRLIHLHELLWEFFEDYRIQAEQKQIVCHYQNPIKDFRILADPDRVHQLLQNIFTNAVKFTDIGRNIYLNVKPFQGRRKTDPSYPMVVISLTDEGHGIPKGQMQKIFDRFSQLRDQSRSEGRGLGLTVAKQISNLHDGNIWVESEEGRGSTFHVLFPHVISRQGHSQNLQIGEKLKPKILIAESAMEKQKNHYDCLKDWGYETIFARDGVEAVTLSFHFVPDALLLTQDLAKLGSDEVFKILRKDPLTAHILLAQVFKNEGAAGSDMIPKLFLPLDSQKLITLLSQGGVPTPTPHFVKKAA